MARRGVVCSWAVMKRSRTYEATGIVLRSRPLGETDRVVVLYTVEEGKLSAVAKGARRANSKLASGVQPFVHGRYGLARGKSLDVVTQCQLIESFYALRTDLDLLSVACCGLELIDRSVEERHPDAEMFELLLAALHSLVEAPDPELAFWLFELRMLEQLGYAPVLDVCSRCGSSESRGARFSSHFGGRLCYECLRHDPRAFDIGRTSVQVLRAVAQGADAPDCGDELEGQPRQELRRVMRELVEHRLDIRLRSQEFADRIA